MRKPTSRLLSMLMVLAMVLTMLPASVFAASDTETPVNGWNLTLGDNIGVNFHVAIDEADVAQTVANITVAGNTVTANATDAPQQDGCYVFTAEVAAAQMTDVITLEVVTNGEQVYSGTYSVRDYAMQILNGQYDKEIKEMVRSMLHFGAAAQTYFSYNTGSLANAGIDAAAAVELPTSVESTPVEGSLEGLYCYGTSLVFQSNTAVRFYFRGTGDIANYTFTVDGTPYTPVPKGVMYYVEISDINPDELADSITVVVTDGEGQLTVSYSPLQYIVNKYSGNSSDSLKALLAAMYAYHLEAKEYVVWDAIEPVTVDGGVMANHANGKTDTGLYFTMEANNAPYDGWSVEYTPVAAENLKLIRDGETYNIGIPGRGTLVKYSATEYYLKLESWTVGEYATITESDVLVIEGDFYHSATKTTLNISKSYIYHDGSAWVISNTLPTTIDAGVMSKHSTNGWASNGVYAVMAENDAPYDGWSVEYTPVAAENLKLIRGGETFNIGIPGRGTLVKYSATEYFLKMEWNVGDYAPMQDGDILIVEGGFINQASKVTLNISKTYIYANGSNVEFSTEMPTLPTTIDAGVMSKHSTNGWASNGVYAVMAENDAPYDGWSVEYTPVAAENLKLIRGGETFNIGIPGRGTLVKYSATEYFLKMEWNVGDYAPMQDGDVLIVEGGFINQASKVTLNISKTYIQAKGDTVVFSTTEPVQTTVVEGGNMTEHADGWDASGTVFFTLGENAVPVDENAEVAYIAESDVIMLVRDGASYALTGSVVKYGTSDYFLVLDDSNYLPLADQDYLVVEGAFANSDNGYILNISKTYILVDSEAVVFSTTEPVLETEYALTGLTNHANGWSADGIYISHNAHEATINSDWSVEYKPVSADAIKLVRNGVTTSVGQPASGTLVVYNATAMYLKTAAWTITGSVLPFVDGDQIIIEGKFKHEASGDILVVEKTVICVNGDSLIFNPIFAGNMANHSNGVSGEGVYATMAANAAPYDGWNIEYTPVTADAYYVLRDGEQINIGIPGRGTLVKYSDTEYFLKINAWCTNNFAYTTDDIIVIDGFWKNDANSTVMKMDKTYLYYNGSAWVFSAKLPSVVEGGVMQTHEVGMSGSGIYFSMAANEAPYNSDWTLEYTQTSVDNIKLIRDGVTTSIGIEGRPMFVKTSDTQYYLKLEGWTIGSYAPITTDDVLIIEGNFAYAAESVTLNISKSYVYYDGTAWVCSAEEPISLSAVDVTGLRSHANGWTSGGFYFMADANTAPYDTTWVLRYKPVSADAIKLINTDGTETNVGNTGAETVVKYSETEYYVEGWAVGSANMKAGTVLVIDGLFYNAANNTYIDVEKTTITFNEGGSTTIISESNKNIEAGAMSAYTSNWFGDGIYFVLSSNAAPADEGWNVRYTPSSANNIKLIRNGETVSIANTGAETIVKIADGWYWLSLESWWWSANAPMQDGDVLVIEGAFTNASNGYTLNIDKTYITFVSKDNDDVIFSSAVDTEFGEVLLPSSNDTVTIGVWNGSHHVFTDARLAELQAAGITKIIGIDPQWIGSENNWDMNYLLDRMQSYGISVVAYLRQRTEDGTQYSGDDWDGVTVPDYANHPALLGFVMYDEPSAQNFSMLQNLKSQFEALKASGKMPEHLMFFVNLFPECAAYTSWYGNILGKYRDYETDYVDAYIQQLDADVLSWDNYSLLSGSGIRPSYFHNFEIMAAKNSATLPTWYTLLSAGHGTTSTSYSTPTYEELRWQMAVAMTYGISNLDHYIYTSHETDYSTMLDYNTETVTDLYYDVKQADNEIKAWENIYMAYDWQGVGVYDTGSSNAMLTQLERELNLSEYGVAGVSASENLLIGVFDYNGDKAYMVTNAGAVGNTTVGDGKNFSINDTTVTLTLDAADYKCVAVIDNGEISYVAVENNTVTINVEAYEGVFVIPVLN